MNEATKPELKPANDNPWYCLATLYGEWNRDSGQPGQNITRKNRIAWNRWFSTTLSSAQREILLKKGVSSVELTPLNETEVEELAKNFTARSGRTDLTLPDPTKDIRFDGTNFDSDLFFVGYIFPSYVYFDSATFSRGVVFNTATFSQEAYFNSATFSEGAYFALATFFWGAYFKSATFSEIAKFESATFSGEADFESAKFYQEANFESAKFYQEANFISAKFSGSAYFESVTFSKLISFKSATFSGQADFESAMFSKVAEFNSATFANPINFINSEFTANTIFAKAHFSFAVPDFRGAKLHEATEWHGVRWPSAPSNKELAQDQVYAYERLKQEMERLKKHEDEQFFFRKELRARRELVPRWRAAWWFNYLYETLSDYGQSTSKPLLWLCGLFLLVSDVFVWAPEITGTSMTIPQAASLSFASIFAIFPLPKGIMAPDVFATLSSTAQIILVVEAFFGTLLLFLLGVALRNRFRMR